MGDATSLYGRATHFYRGAMPCGCVCAMVVDDPDHPDDTARDVADFIKARYVVTREPFPGAFTRCEAHAGLAHAEWRTAMDQQRKPTPAKEEHRDE